MPSSAYSSGLATVLEIIIVCLYILWALSFLGREINTKNIIIVVVGAVIILAFVGTVAGMIALW
jgi:K+-sensing histidine kinase KdpD